MASKHEFRCSAKEVGKTYRLLMTGYIERDNANAGAEVIAAMERQPAGSALEVQLRDFYGGDVHEGLTIYHAVKDSGATVHADGVVASMGAIILCAGSKVTVTKRTRVMTHRPRGGNYGTADELATTATELENAEKELASILAERTGLTAEQANAEFMCGKDKWYAADKLKAMGLVDEVLPGNSARTVAMVDVRKLRDANDILERFAAAYEGAEEPIEEVKPSPEGAKTKTMKREITAKLGLAEGADDAAVEKAVASLSARADAAEQKLKERDDADNASAEAEATGLIEAALKEDRIGKPQAEALKAEAKKAPKMALSMVKHTLGAMPQHKPLHGSLNALKPGAKSLAELVNSRADWSYSQWAKDDSKMLARLRDEAPELFKQVRENLG